MAHTKYFEGIVWVAEERKGWSPRIKLILAFVIGLLLLSPAILGIHWETLLPQ